MLAFADFAVTVTNAQATAEWWHEKVGLAVHTIGPPGGHAVVVAPPGERFLLHLCEGIAPIEPGNTGIAFMTDHLAERVRAMEAAGVRFTMPFTKSDFGGMAKFVDPDGNEFWLMGAPTEFIEQERARRAPLEKSPVPSRCSRSGRSRSPRSKS